MREIFCNEMIRAYEKKPFVFLTGDLGFKALEPLQARMGEHFINCGIAEQNMISLAAGIAKTGLQVFAYSISPFIYARPFEQIRNDICLHNLPITLVGNGGGYGYGVMGATHHSIEDYGTLLTLQNMNVFVPVFDEDIGAMIEKILTQKKPSYLRLGLAAKVEGVEKKYAKWRKILDGDLGDVVITGSIGSDLIEQFRKDKKSARPAIWLLSELPILENIPDEIQRAKKICIVEEHVAQGGIGQILAAKFLENKMALQSFGCLNAKGYPSGFYGSQKFHREESGLTKSEILKFFNV